MRLRKRTIWTALAILVGAALALPFFWRRTLVFYTDGGRLREPLEAASGAVRDVLWERPEPLGAEINRPELDEYEPRVSPGGDLLIFTRGRPGENADLWAAERMRGGWAEPRPIEEINTAADELGAAFDPAGAALYFYSNRAGGLGGLDIWVSRFDGGRWSAPENLGAPINGPADEMSPAWSPDGRTFYFSSNRLAAGPEGAPWSATLRAAREAADYDLFSAAKGEGDSLEEPSPLSALNLRGWSEGAAAVSPAGDFLYFASNRPGGQGGFDLYRVRLAAADMALPASLLPVNLGPQVNSAADELDPAVAAQGFQLYFARSSGGREDIHATWSREVYRRKETGDPYWDLAAVLAFLGDLLGRIPPVILVLLIALLLYLIALLILRKRLGTLTLLARCFLLALLIHLLMAFWMNRTEVERAIMAALSPPEELELEVVSPGGDPEDDVGLAIREAVADGGEPPVLESAPASTPREEPLGAPESALEESLKAPVDLKPPAAAIELAREAPAPLDLGSVAAGAQEIDPPQSASSYEAPQPSLAERPPAVAAPEPSKDVSLDVARRDTAQAPAEAAVPVPNPSAPSAPASGELAREAAGPAVPPAARPVASPSPPRGSIGENAVVAVLPDAAAGPAAPRLEPRLAPAALSPGSGVARAASTVVLDPLARRREAASSARGATPEEKSTLEPGVDLARAAESVRAGLDVRLGAAPSKTQVLPAGDTAFRPRLEPRGDPIPPPPALAGSTPVKPASGGAAPAREETPALAILRRRPGGVEPSAPDSGSTRTAVAPAVRAAEGARAAAATDAGPRESDVRPLSIEEQPAATAPLARGRAESGSSTFLPRLYELRRPSQRPEALRAGGGSERTERAVERGLAWLALHQSPDGRWSLRDFANHIENPSRRDLIHLDPSGRNWRDSRGGSGNARNGDTAATALALLAFLGHGDTHTEAGPHREAIARGLRWLLGAQRRSGDLRGGGNLYMHATASFALCEAYAFTRDEPLRGPAERAIDFTAASQHPDLGGWRYEPYPQGNDADTSVFGWMLMAVKSARLGGLSLDEECLAGAAAYLDSARMSRSGGRFAYQPGESRTSQAITAQGFFSQQILADTLPSWAEENGERLRRAADESIRFILDRPPRLDPNGGTDYYYWYYATLALFQEGGEVWAAWNKPLSDLLVRLQLGDEEGTAAGSWDPIDHRATAGGRVYSTALGVLCLEVYYRYRRIEGR